MHYVPFAAKDEKLRAILRGIIGKQASQILTDPYANAFNEVPDGRGHQDKTQLNDWVWERKYELDSLCAPLLSGTCLLEGDWLRRYLYRRI